MKRHLLAVVMAFCTVPVVQAQFHNAPETPYVPGEMLVQLKAGYSLENILPLLPAAAQASNKGLLASEVNIWHIGFNHQAVSHYDFMKALYAIPGVQNAQNNHYIDEVRATVPNDANFNTQQWHHKNTGQTGGTNDADIDSDLAWDITTGGVTADGDSIVVCIVEGGGAEWTHNDLIPNAWRNYDEIDNNGIDDDGNGYIDDVRGWRVSAGNDNHLTGSHGTQCMGMVGARGNNSIGVAGANWNVKMMLVSGFSVSESSVISAYNYPLKMRKMYNSSNGTTGAFVVATSSSWGIDNANHNSYPLWCAFYDSLGVHGILNPCATTNITQNIDAVGDMPTTCPSPYMVSVTRTGETDNQAGGTGIINVDLGAPGIDVATTTNGNGYTSAVTGTSFACPLTAGVIGLLYSVQCNTFMNIVKNNPKAGADSILVALYGGVDAKSSLASTTATGGRLNAFNSVNLMLGMCSCANPGTPVVSAITNSSATITVTSFAGAAGYWYYYGIQGSGTYDSVFATGTNVSITGLDSCETYEVFAKSDCGSDMSTGTALVTFETVGDCTSAIEDPAAGIVTYQVYPNPANEGIWIEIYNYASLGSGHKLEVFNAQGQLVTTHTITSKTTYVDMRTLQNGMYMYRLKFTPGFERSGSFVIAR